MPADGYKVSVDCGAERADDAKVKKVIATVRAVAREAGGEVRGEDASWSVVCRSEADAQFAALRLATEIDGIAVEDGSHWRVDLVPERAIVAGPEQHRLLFPHGTRGGLVRQGRRPCPRWRAGPSWLRRPC
jgi:hypothetical protein